MTSAAALVPPSHRAATACDRARRLRSAPDLRPGRVLGLAGAALVVVLAGCASLVTRPVPPQIEVAGVRLVAGGADALRARVLLDVRNPNPFAVSLVSVEARLAIEAVPVATAFLPAPVTLPANGTAQVEVEARAELAGVRQALSRVLRSLAAGYDVTGVAVVQDGIRLDFRRQGALPLADLLGRLR